MPPQFVRFAIVGILCFVIDYALLVLLTECTSLVYITANIISYIVSVLINYILSRIYVFAGKEKGKKMLEIILFILFSLIGLGFTELIMWFSVEILGMFYAVAKWLSTTIVTFYNYVTRKYLLE